MQKQNNQRYLRKIIKVFIQQLISVQFQNFIEEDKYIEKFILNQVVPLGNLEGNLIEQIKEILTDPEVHHPKKYLPLLYISLIDVDPDKISDLFKFYYQLTSHAIKQLKEGKLRISDAYWENVLQKIYQYGMLLLIGSRSILLNVQSLGARVNSQLFSSKAKEMRLSRLVKVYNCILCIPEKYLTLKQTLYLTLIFTRWELHENSLFTPSFFANFTLKTQKKLIRKLKNYPQNAFNQEHILNLIKIILGGDELVFSYYLQIKYTYQALKFDNKKNSFRTDISVFESLKKCHVNRQSRHLFNFILQLLVNLKNQQILQSIERQSIIFVCLKYLSGKFENNQNLYVILVKHLLHQNNSTIFQMSFRFIREQALQYLTVHKVKLLLNVFNIQNWGTILKQNKADEAIILNKLQRILTLLDVIARKYSQSSLVLYCMPNKYAVSIAGTKGLKSLVLVCAFDGIGRLNQTNALQMKILKISIGKDVYEIIVSFTENLQNLRIEASPQSKERSASLIIKINNKQQINERKQYLRFSQGGYESFIAMSLNEKSNSLAFCIDGAYYEFPYRKGQMSQIDMGCMFGSIRNFYALKAEVDLISFYKNWCESNRKTKYVIQALGSQQIAYKLNNREDSVIVDNNKSGGFSFFQSKIQIKVNVTPVKHITFIDILLQLGGLETVFFILERFSRSLMQFRSSQQKINVLIANLFKFLKIVGILDESNSLLSDISNCFKYLNEFLFLLIKRNKIVRQSKDSFLIMSIFQLLVYFRKTTYHYIPNFTLQKMINIETNLILKTLVNFQIWSHCSYSLQLFVLSQIEVYIKQKKHCQALIKQDLHKELLSGLILFQTSKIPVPYSPQIQHKIIFLCTVLYEHSKQYLIQSLQLNKNESQKYKTFVDRDINTCFTLIKFLLSNFKLKHFSQSEKSAFNLLAKYIIQNFARKNILFEIIGKAWQNYMSILCNCVQEMEIMDRQILCNTSYIIIIVTSRQDVYDVWLLRYFESITFNNRSDFNDCLFIFVKIVEKYIFETTRKYTIINRMLVCLKSKLDAFEWRESFNSQVQDILKLLTHAPLYHLSCQDQFIQLYLELYQRIANNRQEKAMSQQMKRPYEEIQSQIHQQPKQQASLEQGKKVWKSVNSYFLETLYRQTKITNFNAKFVSILLQYQSDGNPFKNSEFKSLNSILQKLVELKEKAKDSHINVNNPFIGFDICSTYALIQHCRGWQTIQFLMKNGLLTIENDLNIPYPLLQKQEQLASICGTVGYYLSHNPNPLQLFILFNIILYRQLSNNITILTTQANIAIFQYSIQYLIQQCNSQKSSLNEGALWNDIGVLLVILKDLIKLLNNSFIYKTALICKDIDKLLAPLIIKKGESWKNKKSGIILQNLSKALQKVQIALEDTKIDKDISVFIDFISCKISLTHEKQNKNQVIALVFSLVDDLKTKNWIAHQQQFKKLHILGIKFFKIAREYYLSKKSQIIFDYRTDKRYNQKIQQPNPKQKQAYLSYWNFLTQNFDNILQQLNDRGNESQQIWQNLLITNQHWFQLQQDLNDVTTKFYQLDEKETGPFGFYKLNIRPVRSNHQKLPYPRKKEYSQMISKKQKFQKEKEQSLACQRSTIQLTNTTLFSALAQSRQKSTVRLTQKLSNEKMTITQKQYFCEYVTKRGVYAGVICKKKDMMQFRFTGYDALPPDKVYQTSTNKCHRIQQLSEWEEKEIKIMKIRLSGSKIFTRRYILRHTAFELFHNVKHRSYFFNLFFNQPLQNFLYELKSSEADIVQRRPDQFAKSGYTQRWRKGQISNFQYLGLVNRYSGRTTNDLVQYYVMPWVITNYNGQNNYKEIDKEFYKNSKNLRDLSLPTGKLNPEKFSKLKARLIQVDASDRQIRFLYGTMYSNPTVLYNFFIRLEPYTSLHWQHQGRKIDHADRLFSGVYEQFNTILTSSSDMKELAPQFYYWTQFLRNRNRIDLGTRQKGEDVDAVVLPVWARSPQEFIFKMREALQSNYASSHLHQWIDLIFGYKSPLSVAQQHDNLYHFQCYEHDLFQDYQTQNEMKIAQIAISQFGQVAQQVFMKQHPQRYTRKQMNIDIGIIIHKDQSNQKIIGFQLNEAGIMMWNQNAIIFKKVAISGLYNSFEWTKDFQNKSKLCVLTSVNFMKWFTLSGGVLKMFERGKAKMQKPIQSKCFDIMGNYIFYSCGSKMVILQIKGQVFQLYNTLYGHRDQVITIKTDFILDLIVSVDRSGYVLIHELTELRFLRAFQLGTNFEGQQCEKLRVCIHRMGYFIFLDHQQTLWIFNYMGELILEQDIQIRTVDNKQDEEKVTQIQIFSHQHSLILLSSTKGSIFLVNFLDIIRFKETYPYKTFSRVGRNLLDGVRSKTAQNFHGKSIRQFTLVKTVGQKSAIYQLLVLYQTNELVCYTEQRQMGQQLKTNPRLKSMGFF